MVYLFVKVVSSPLMKFSAIQTCISSDRIRLHCCHNADKSRGSQVSKRTRSLSMQELSTVSVAAEPISRPEPTNRRDMGTQMTPIETPENSTCTTPGLTASPTRHNNTPAEIRAYSLGAIPVAVDSLELQTRHMEKLELRNLAADDQPGSLDRSNIWTTREEEEMESAASLREDPEELERFQLAAKATSWEEAEQSKALVRLLFLSFYNSWELLCLLNKN